MEDFSLEEVRIAYKKEVCQVIDKLFKRYGIYNDILREELMNIGERKYNEFIKKTEAENYDFDKNIVVEKLSCIFEQIIESYCLNDIWKRKITIKCHYKGIHDLNDINKIISDVGFAYAMDKHRNITPTSNWSKYLSGIIENKIKDFINRPEKQIPTIPPYAENDKKSLVTIPEPVSRYDEIPYPREFSDIKLSTFLKALLQCLPYLSKEDYYIVNRRYFDGLTLEEIGEELGKDRSYVRRQLEKIYSLLKVKITKIAEEECQ